MSRMPSNGAPPDPVTIALTADDLAEYGNWCKKRVRRRSESWSAVLMLLGIAALLLMCTDTSLAAAAVCAVVIFGSLLALARSQDRRQHGTYVRRAALASGTLSADHSGVRLESILCAATYTWGCFTEVADTGGLVCLMTCPECAIIVPKRAFPNREHAGAFVDFVEAHLREARDSVNPRP